MTGRTFTVFRAFRLLVSFTLLLLLVLGWWFMIGMPGKSFRGPAPPLTADEVKVRAELMAHVQMLGGTIGERNLSRYPQLLAAAQYIESQFSPRKLTRDTYDVHGKQCYNIQTEIPGRSPEIVLVGAHYDSVFGSPGANDNGSGVAALLALAHRFGDQPNERTIRFVAFVNEEPGHFQTGQMGSYVYAARCRQRADPIRSMISLETIGYFSDRADSQKYPVAGLGLFYPRVGNFIGFVGNLASRHLVREAIGEFRRRATIPSEGAALPEFVPGVGWSDQWSFWQHSYPGIMVTDTAPFRYPHYHSVDDTPDKLDYDAMARVVLGMESVIRQMANPTQ